MVLLVSDDTISRSLETMGSEGEENLESEIMAAKSVVISCAFEGCNGCGKRLRAVMLR